jgi:hypothetical protein
MYPTAYAFRLPDEQTQEASQFSPASPVWLDELGSESLSWCVWGSVFSNPIRTNLSKDEAKSSSICDDIRKIIQISFSEGARTWQVYHRWSVP